MTTKKSYGAHTNQLVLGLPNPQVSDEARQAFETIRAHCAANDLGQMTPEITDEEVKAILYKTG